MGRATQGIVWLGAHLAAGSLEGCHRSGCSSGEGREREEQAEPPIPPPQPSTRPHEELPTSLPTPPNLPWAVAGDQGRVKACLGYQGLVKEREVRGGVLIHRLGHRRGQRGHKVKMGGSQASATGRVMGDCSLVAGFHGVTASRSHLGARCPATPQSWMERLPAAHSSSPATSRPQSADGEDAEVSGSAPGVFPEITLGSALILPDDPLHPCSLTIPIPTPSLHPPPLTRGCAPSSPSNPLITLSSHLLYHFHNLPNLQLQLVCLLRAVAEVHFAPFWGAPRFGRATWDAT